jgi:hypothetical protein
LWTKIDAVVAPAAREAHSPMVDLASFLFFWGVGDVFIAKQTTTKKEYEKEEGVLRKEEQTIFVTQHLWCVHT